MPNIQVAIDAREASKGAEDFVSAVNRIVESGNRASESVDKLDKHLQEHSGTLTEVKAKAVEFAALLGFGYSAEHAFEQIKQYDESLAHLGIRTGLTGQALDDLGDSFRTIGSDSQIGATGLVRIASAAAQLGVSSDKLVEFTKTAAAFGGLSGLGGEEGSRILYRTLLLSNENIDSAKQLASVYLELGNKSGASAAELSNMSLMLLRMTQGMHFTSTEAAALGATLASLGEDSGRGVFGITQALRSMQRVVEQETPKRSLLASVVGIDEKDVAQAFQQDSFGFFKLFLQGLHQIQQEGGNTALVMERLGLGGGGFSRAIPLLVNNIDRLEETLKKANEAAHEGTAVDRERAIMAGTLEGALNKLHAAWESGIDAMAKYKGPLVDVLDTARKVVNEIFGIAKPGEAATTAIKAMAIATETLIGAMTLLVAIKIVLFFSDAGAAAASLTLKLLGIIPAIIAIGAVAAGIEYARYFIDQNKAIQVSLQNLVDSFLVGFRTIEYYAAQANIKSQEGYQKYFPFLSSVSGSIARGVAKAAGYDDATIDSWEKQSNDFENRRKELKAKYEEDVETAVEAHKLALEQIDQQFNDPAHHKSFWQWEMSDAGAIGAAISLAQSVGAQVRQALGLDHGATTQATTQSSYVGAATRPTGEGGLSATTRPTFNPVADQLAQIQNQRDLIQLTNEERQIRVEMIKIQKETGLPQDDEHLRQIEAELRYNKDLQENWKRMTNIADDTGNAFGNAFTTAITGAKSLQKIMQDLATTIEQTVLKNLIAAPIAGVISGGLSNVFGGFLGTPKPVGNTPFSPVKSASGNVFPGGVHYFGKGGVTDSETIFGFSGGVGVMGEGGRPEAVLPLERSADGRLGVQGGNVTHNWYITTPDADSFRRSKTQIAMDLRKVTR